jgi:hypothetical protein
MQDNEILQHIKEMLSDEQKLFAKSELSDDERNRLHKLQEELDQYWDLLRQRKALREFGKNPEKAKLRGKDTVENYEQ